MVGVVFVGVTGGVVVLVGVVVTLETIIFLVGVATSGLASSAVILSNQTEDKAGDRVAKIVSMATTSDL